MVCLESNQAEAPAVVVVAEHGLLQGRLRREKWIEEPCFLVKRMSSGIHLEVWSNRGLSRKWKCWRRLSLDHSLKIAARR